MFPPYLRRPPRPRWSGIKDNPSHHEDRIGRPWAGVKNSRSEGPGTRWADDQEFQPERG
ncbi:MAG: hypothetical protein MZU91_10660 [Desulfosudis oleivorans]|nr:hypothetical protein [Desulfosudis oleivorans]